jgi:hypothetical protein
MTVQLLFGTSVAFGFVAVDFRFGLISRRMADVAQGQLRAKSRHSAGDGAARKSTLPSHLSGT